MTNRQAVAILICLAVVAFANTLGNDFTGDAKALFTHNTFYKSLENVPRLFSPALITRPEEFSHALSFQTPSFSGCVSYRPVTAATFFVDYFVFGPHPAGHHLTNLLWHLLACLGVYALARRLLPGGIPAACLAVCLFAVHPIQSEVVSSIGYRSDLISATFVLAAFLLYLRARAGRGKENFTLALSGACLFLALFSKESALMFLPLLAAFEWLYRKTPPASGCKKFYTSAAAVFGLVTSFYAYVYFVRMPNAFYTRFLPDQTLFTRLATAATILLKYLTALVWPFSVHVVPPVHLPPATHPFWAASAAAVILSGAAGLAWRARRERPFISFGLAWFVLFYLPASNALTLLNPFAFRFLYLPSAGLFLAVAPGLLALCRRLASKNLERIAVSALIFGLLVLTVTNNFFFKNSFVAAKELVRRYPESSRAHWLLGVEYYERGRLAEAKQSFLNYLHADTHNPFVLPPENNASLFHLLGRCSAGNADEAAAYFQRAIVLDPQLVSAYVDLAWLLMSKKDFKQALPYARQTIKINDNLAVGYVFAAACLVELGRWAEARPVLEAGLSKWPANKDLVRLKNKFDASHAL